MDSEISYYISKAEVKAIISEAYTEGFRKGLEYVGEQPKYISERKAFKLYQPSRVRNWVKDGLITSKPNGNGQNSTKYYEVSRLNELDASDKIRIRKPYKKIQS